MTVFPIILDSTPPYLEPTGTALSLALMPYGHTTFGRHLSDVLLERTGRRPVVVRTFDAAPGYDTALTLAGATTSPSQTVDQLYAGLEALEPSDWMLFVDPRCFPGTGYDAQPLLDELTHDLTATPRIVRHLVALDGNAAGTSERVEFDKEGRVRRIQRYYDSVTWTVTAGVCASLVPVASMLMNTPVAFTSLTAFRRGLSAQSLASRDIPCRGQVADLDSERGLLRLTERALAPGPEPELWQAAAPATTRPIDVVVHPSARLLGHVALHPGAFVGEGATIVGPAVVGAGARVERGAVVAQSLVSPGFVVPPGAVVRHRVIASAAALAGQPAAPVFEIGGDDEDDTVQLHEDTPRRRYYPIIKLSIEASLATVAVALLSPVMLLVAVLIKLDSRGPILYGDLREAKDGKPFRCFKFRTMSVGADAAQRDLMAANQVDGPQFKMTYDPRVTRLGRLLRPVSLDELPQLFNVMFGQMSLVGPRPSPFRENQTCVPWRDARLSVRPGITGLWQVCRHDRASGDFHQWIYYDMQYVRHMSPWVDIKIIAATIFTLGGKGHVPFSWIVSNRHDATTD